MDAYRNQSKVTHMCKIHWRMEKNMLDNRESIRAADIAGMAIGVKRSLRARYLAVDNYVIDFISFARSELLPVTSCHIKSCAEQAAKRRKIQSSS